MKRIAVLVVSFILLGSSVQWGAAQSSEESPLKDQTWVRLGGPPGGVGYDIRMNPDDPDIMFVTDSGAGIHKSVDRGKTWFTVNEGVDLRAGFSGDMIPVFSATIDPNNPDTVWIGLKDLGGLYRSDDNGQTWVRKTNGIQEGQGLTFRGISVQPGNSDIVFAAAEISSELWAGEILPGRGFGVVKGVIYKSENRGESWKAVWRGDNLARYVLINPDNTNIIYASTGIFDREAANDTGVGVLKSTDGGRTWKEMNNGLGNLYVNSLDFHPDDPNIIIAGTKNFTFPTAGGAYITYDGAETWEHVVGTEISAVEFVDEDPNYMYAAGQHEFFRSRDGGQTWQPFQNDRGLYGPNRMIVGIAMDFQVDPDDPNRIFLNTYQGGNFYSENGGESWVPTSLGYSGLLVRDVEVSQTNPAFVVASGRTGPFVSHDGGLNWVAKVPLDDNTEGVEISIDPQNNDHLLMGDGDTGCIRESVDQGENWKWITCHRGELGQHLVVVKNEFAIHQGPLALTYSTADPSIVYAGFGLQHCFNNWDHYGCDYLALKSILISSDGGRSWRTIEDPEIHGLTVAEVAIHPENPDIAWAATSNGVKKTEDGGRHWSDASMGISATIMTSVAVDPVSPDTLYATGNGGMFISYDGGSQWERSGNGIDPNEIVTSVVFDLSRQGILYASTMRSGVFLSEDNGETWVQINDGLTMRSVYKLAISSDGNTLYAATNGGGVYRLSTLTQEDFEEMAQTAEPPASAEQPRTDIIATGISIDGNLEDWAGRDTFYADPPDDAEEGYLEFTDGYAFSNDDSLYFLIETADPNMPFVQFDIQFKAGDHLYQISWGSGGRGFLGDYTDPAHAIDIGEVEFSEFAFGDALEGRIDFRDLDFSGEINLESINAMAGQGDTWRQVDFWTPDINTPYEGEPSPSEIEPTEEPTEAAMVDDAVEPDDSSGGLPCLGSMLVPFLVLGLVRMRREKGKK